MRFWAALSFSGTVFLEALLYTQVSFTEPHLCKSFLKNQKEHWGNLKITITLHYICASYRFSASFHAYLRPHSRRAEWAPFHCHRNVTEKKIQGVTPLNAISLWHAHAKEKSAHFRIVLFFAYSQCTVVLYKLFLRDSIQLTFGFLQGLRYNLS